MTLDVLRAVAWPLVVLVVALGVFKRFDVWRDMKAKLAQLEGRCDYLESIATTAAAHAKTLEKRYDEEHAVVAHTSNAVAEINVQLEKTNSKLQAVLAAAGNRAMR